MTGVQVVIFSGVLVALFLLLRILGGYAPGWIVICNRCGRARKASEAGMIRIGKAGVSSSTFDWCSNCKGVRGHTVVRESTEREVR